MLGNILGSVASSILNNGNNNQSVAIQLIQVLLQSQGGIEGIIKRFQESGLEGILKSWISTDENNQPISANQVVEVVGQENMSQAAQKVGVSEWDASNVLAEYLPKMVDMLTPNGQLPDLNNLNVNDLMAQAAKGMLGKLFS
ncbi:MAG: YidB family protein [Haemophilus parahaemolyticus]|uniref:YidB family protein n=1 Tax=Haemophilus parahaemolyticus TaxID=735 RepID=UPI0027F3B835|nr:YidB family protein [Haemophilus parahaemolyticus]MDQ6576188.1 YidB family protein [Haemophilus parahaemolyticus]